MNRASVASLLLVFTLGACQRPPPQPTRPCIVVAATTDVHGALFPQEIPALSGTLRRWGLSAVSAYVDLLRRRHAGRVLLVDAGDLMHGTLVGSLTRGGAVIDAYNALGYHAVALGNHEFDFGPRTATDPNPTGVLEDRMHEARFPFLAANLFLAGTERRPPWPNFAASTIVQLDGLQVGLVGAITVETPRVTRPQYVAHLEFRDPVPPIIAEAESLRRRGAQLVLLVAHLGGRCQRADDPRDASSCDGEGELIRTLTALPHGTVDGAVGGHHHTRINHWVNGVPTLEPTASARQLGWMELCAQPDGGLDPQRSTLHPLVDLCLDEWTDGGCADREIPIAVRPATFLGQPLTILPAVQATLDRSAELVRRRHEMPLGVDLPGPLRVGGTPALEQVICRATAEAAGTSIALHNRGGVRAALPAGALRYGQAFEVLPFGNQVAVLRLTGTQLTDFARILFTRRDAEPFSYGLRVTAGEPVEVRLADGTRLRPERTYRVATNDYLAYGGEGVDEAIGRLAAPDLELLDLTLLDAFVALLRREYPAP